MAPGENQSIWVTTQKETWTRNQMKEDVEMRMRVLCISLSGNAYWRERPINALKSDIGFARARRTPQVCSFGLKFVRILTEESWDGGVSCQDLLAKTAFRKFLSGFRKRCLPAVGPTFFPLQMYVVSVKMFHSRSSRRQDIYAFLRLIFDR